MGSGRSTVAYPIAAIATRDRPRRTRRSVIGIGASDDGATSRLMLSRVLATRLAAALAVAVLAPGCGDGGDTDATGAPGPGPVAEETPAQGSTGVAIPDGGTQRGHDRGAAATRSRIRVPERDTTPPDPTVELLGERTGRGEKGPHVRLPAGTERVHGTVTGVDPDGGMGRARVAFRMVFGCRNPASGRSFERPYVHYVPPPQIARVRIAPGTRVRTRLVRRAGVTFDESRCEGAKLESVRGEVWADVTNASGLDATSAHISFSSQ
jgi:hypothetical protein